MPCNNKYINLLAMSLILPLAGCDYIESIKSSDSLNQQQTQQLAQQKARIDLLEKQIVALSNGTKALAGVVGDLKKQQEAFVFTEFNPQQTKYFILNNGAVGLAARVTAIDPVDNGSVVKMSLVNLLSVPVSNIGFHVTWGNEKPLDQKALAKWQQLLFSTAMDSSLKLLPGQWQDINLTLKGVSPNNLKYLKMAINMDNLQFDTLQPATGQQKKAKK
ncbi:SadB/YajI family lipoprotein [Pseudocitrobacter cyperus]|uniref:DUF3251 domain-containing protein n=1 Tax=Pseudocitrobacter cyperus TaxID=3112843 RepID=A0ABV0HM60_9ENTR